MKLSYAEFLEVIGEYESDTFSASGNKLTQEETKEIAQRCLSLFKDNYLDGILISEFLEEIREK